MPKKLDTRNLRTVNQFCDTHPAFTPGGMRWKIHKADENGLAEAGVIVRIDGSVYLDEERWDIWAENKQLTA